MQLDLRAPSIVISGAWNPAIFRWQWFAKFILELEEGSNIDLMQTVVNPIGKQITYIDDIGFSVDETRFELFCNKDDNELIAKLCHLSIKLIRILEHTPVVEIGVNFRYFERDPDPEVVDKLSTHDNFDDLRVVESKKTNVYEVDENFGLNFSRTINDQVAVFDFNYFLSANRFDEALDQLPDSILNFRAKSEQRILELYEVDTADSVVHEVEKEDVA
ncbi:MAG: hypothetical protein NPIRA05_23350 [Nitrospirales bacterium]|nr:MAG: hypothetical protein NPIRA05_23350 [Nitrospirales bacterium]GJM42156.1 MAG: hypothetical protein DHS20C20_24380 [Ardenticatenaceae bacterium]